MGRLERLYRRVVDTGPTGFVEKLFFVVLFCLSVFYGAVIHLRNAGFRLGLFSVYRSQVPVISVGNLTAGGTGKTPVVDFLLQWFEARGVRTAVVSRGFGGSFSGALAVVSAGDGPRLPAFVCGDEPYLLSQKNPLARVYIAPRRRVALELINRERQVDVVVLDDAFQHRHVARDLDIVLLDAEKPLGNGRVLPAGVLRESPSSLQRADLLILTRAVRGQPLSLLLDKPVCQCSHQLAQRVASLAGELLPLEALRGKQGVAFAGIASPAKFFSLLTEAGLTLTAVKAFKDHVAYTQHDLDSLASLAAGAEFLITTEKDAVKLQELELTMPCYIAQLEIEFHDIGALTTQLQGILQRIEDEKHH